MFFRQIRCRSRVSDWRRGLQEGQRSSLWDSVVRPFMTPSSQPRHSSGLVWQPLWPRPTLSFYRWEDLNQQKRRVFIHVTLINIFLAGTKLLSLSFARGWQTSEKGQIGNKFCGASGLWILHLCCCREKADMTIHHQMGWLCSNKMLFMEKICILYNFRMFSNVFL